MPATKRRVLVMAGWARGKTGYVVQAYTRPDGVACVAVELYGGRICAELAASAIEDEPVAALDPKEAEA